VPFIDKHREMCKTGIYTYYATDEIHLSPTCHDDGPELQKVPSIMYVQYESCEITMELYFGKESCIDSGLGQQRSSI